MDTTTIAITVIGAVSTIVSMTALIYTTWIKPHIDSKRKNKEKRKQEYKAMFNEAIDERAEAYSDMIESKINKAENNLSHKIDLNNVGTCASLRNQLKHMYEKAKRKNSKSTRDAENFEEMYQAYIQLGGNSFVKSQIKPDWDAIPIVDKGEY